MHFFRHYIVTITGHEFGQTPRDSGGQGSLACCSPWGHKELDKTEQLSLHSYVLKSLIFLLNFCLLAPSIIEIGMLVSSNNYRSVYFTFYFYQLCFVLKSCLYKGRITSLMNVSFDHYEVSLLNIMY